MTSTRPGGATPRTPRLPKEQVRSRVLRAAGAVFAERGYAAASLDQVAAAAGFTKGAVYSSFGSKDELFLALMDAEAATRVAAVEAALDRTVDLPTALAAVGAELAQRDPAWQLLFLEFWQRAVREPAVRTAFVTARRELRGRVAAVVDRFLAEHPVHTGWDAASLTVVVLALTHGLAVEGLPDPEAVPDGLLTQVLADLVDPAPPTPR
ncbi:TetR/AcrR family transcriptional regulator [Modestobacter sp. SYSU DS0290]